ncbi:MAG: hypothetical protein CMC79_02560 [Flavobacteriaceae bacterium]|nr:hypothetical protein [Flavobacteriaceae bacterium]|tara:strand:+ start:35947 stop:36966 length:1020 start_codon:yes stop_codon:yes gene_type:complete
MKRVFVKIILTLILLIISSLIGVRIYFNVKEIPIYDLKLAYNFITSSPKKLPQYEGLAEKLGYNKEDKLLIIHADDLGLSPAVNEASFDANNKGFITSASVMMPTPYAKEVAEYFKNNPNMDLGLHLTFTSEWKSYKWSGVSISDSIPSLINSNGNFYQNKKTFIKKANPKDVRKELQAQIDRAIALGIKPTHLDSHEGALFFSTELFKIYLELGRKNKLPVFVPRVLSAHFDKNFPKPKNLVIVDKMHMAEKGLKFDDWEKYYTSVINKLKPGLNELIVHLSYDNEEMQFITSGRKNYGSKWRSLDYLILSSPKFKNALIKNNVKLVKWKQIKDIMYP